MDLKDSIVHSFREGREEEVVSLVLGVSSSRLQGSFRSTDVEEKTRLREAVDAQDLTYCEDFCETKGAEEELDKHVRLWDPILLWFQPRQCCVSHIGRFLRQEGLRKVASVGCGSGLFEWVLQRCLGLEVVGYEVNESWWRSPYSPPSFIPHIYPEDGVPSEAAAIIPPASHALLFCYFNDARAFGEYVEGYEGKSVIIIGSQSGERLTNPSPLALMNSQSWGLRSSHAQKSQDVICCYSRKDAGCAQTRSSHPPSGV